MQGMREICDRYGILLIADEVMGGFGRTGKWFAVDHWGVVPDMITMAKGLTSAYVQLGALGMRRHIADHFAEKVFGAGLTYNSHPLACATALATIGVYEDDGLIERAAKSGKTLRAHHERMKAKHPCVGPIRNIGLFGIMELVRDPKSGTPIAGFNETAPEMVALGKFFRANGLYTIVRWNGFFTNPPLNISDEEMDFAFDVIDRGLSEVDATLGLA
jgi:taurine--2-oxoglutarate transaminase